MPAGKTSSRSLQEPGESRARGRPTLAEARLLTGRILDVAEQEFLTQGYDNARIDVIAARAGVTKGALYLRFADKMALFAEVCARLVKRLYQADMVNLSDELPMRESLRRQALGLLMAATNPTTLTFYGMIVGEASKHPKLAQVNQTIWDFYIERLASYFESRMRRALLRLSNPVVAAELFAGMIFSPLHVSALHGLPLPPANELERHVDHVVLLFLGGIGRLELEGLTPD